MMDVSEIEACDDPQLAFSIFHKSYTKIYDQCFPMRKTKINYRSKKNIANWCIEKFNKNLKKSFMYYLRNIQLFSI